MKCREDLINISDNQIVERINRKDKEVSSPLYKKYWAYLITVSSVYAADRNIREELVQEFLTPLYTTSLFNRINKSLSSYLVKYLRDKILNHFRKQAIYYKGLAIATPYEPDRYIGLKEQMEKSELDHRIDFCVQLLPDKYREIYILKTARNSV